MVVLVLMTRNPLNLRGVDKKLYELRALYAPHWIAKRVAHISGHVVVAQKSLIVL